MIIEFECLHGRCITPCPAGYVNGSEIKAGSEICNKCDHHHVLNTLEDKFECMWEPKVTCADCKYGIDVNENGQVKLCDNPDLKSFGKNVKHGHRFSCGYGVMWNDKGESK